MLFVRRALSASHPRHRSLPSLLVRASPRLTLPLPALSPASRRTLSTSAQQDARDAYEVLGVQKSVNADDLTAIYKTLAREHHPDRHQGDARAAAEAGFQVCAPRPRGQTSAAVAALREGSRHLPPPQEISEAYQLLSDPMARQRYDAEMKAATTEAARQEAASKFRANTWNSKVPDVRERLKNAEQAKGSEAAKGNNHLIAGGLLFLTANFVMVFNWLAG